MTESNVITFMENGGITMTIDEGFAFVERSRRQLDRFIFECSEKGQRLVPEYEVQLRANIDSLEASLLTQRAVS